MSYRRILLLLAAFAAVLVGSVAVPTAASAHDATRAARLQQTVNEHLAHLPGWHQTSANTIATEGATATFSVPGDVVINSVPSCTSGHLCIRDGVGGFYDYYYCQRYPFDGVGDGWFNNNQTSGTVARFYNSDGTLRWTNTAKDTGTASWTPVYYIRRC